MRLSAKSFLYGRLSTLVRTILRSTLGLMLATTLITSLTFFDLAYAQRSAPKAASSASMSAEALGAKAFLEDLLARRYSQELATKVDQKSFSLGTQLELTKVAKPVVREEEKVVQQEPISDLMLGTIDPEALLKKYTGSEEHTTAEGILATYRIKTVVVSIGLKEDIPAETKAEVEAWLTGRLASEFGKNGKGVVSIIKGPIVKVEPKSPTTLWDFLSQFQSFAGQLVLAIAILLGTILWRLLQQKPVIPEAPAASAGASPGQLTSPPKVEADPETLATKKLEEENLSIRAEIDILARKLTELAPKIRGDFENMIRSWCRMGEAGQFRLVCFAEAVGHDIGRLPIPVDAINDVSKVFARMSDADPREKRDAMKKAYWDILSVLNVGAQSLDQPFGYMGSLSVDVVNQVLMEENPKMKTLVALYMPDDLRSRYVKSLSIDAKRDLLTTAADMSQIGSDELKSMDGGLMSKLGSGRSNENVVPLDMTLNKLVQALSPIEEATLLPKLAGTALGEFKRTTPSIAFLGEWPSEKLSLLLSRANADEVTAFLRVRPEEQEKFLGLCPPMTAEIVTEELSQIDRMDEKEKNARLTQLQSRVKEFVRAKEIDLQATFARSSAEKSSEIDQGSNVHAIKSVA